MDTLLSSTTNAPDSGMEEQPHHAPSEGENGVYNITLFEACEKLNKSRKTVSRYVRRGLLHPRKVRSKQGTLEYRFNQQDLQDFKSGHVGQAGQDTEDETRQVTPHRDSRLPDVRTTESRQATIDRTDETGISEEENDSALLKEEQGQTGQDTRDKTGQNAIIALLKETTAILKDQLTTKDQQIGRLNTTVDQLVERNREMNILLKGVQDRALMLESPSKKVTKKYRQTGPKPDVTDGTDKTGATPRSEPEEKKKSFWRKLLQEPT